MQESSANQQNNLGGVRGGAKKNSLLPVVIILAVLLVISAGGMIWSLMRTHAKDEEINNLTIKLAENDIKLDEEMNVESDEDALSRPVESVSTPEPYEDGQGPYIKDGYFYVPEWGVKYRLSDELTDYGYAVVQDSLSNSFGKYEIGMTAVDKGDLISHPQARYYDDIFTCSAVTVTRTDQDLSNLFGPKKIVNAGGAQYVIYDYNAHGSCDFESKTSKVVDRLVDIFSNPEKM